MCHFLPFNSLRHNISKYTNNLISFYYPCYKIFNIKLHTSYKWICVCSGQVLSCQSNKSMIMLFVRGKICQAIAGLHQLRLLIFFQLECMQNLHVSEVPAVLQNLGPFLFGLTSTCFLYILKQLEVL